MFKKRRVDQLTDFKQLIVESETEQLKNVLKAQQRLVIPQVFVSNQGLGIVELGSNRVRLAKQKALGGCSGGGTMHERKSEVPGTNSKGMSLLM